MAQHGYLREYDEGPDRDDDRDRWSDTDRGREPSEQDRQRGWRNESDQGNRDPGFMFDRNRERPSSYGEDRDFAGRIGDRARSWFRDDDRQYRTTHEDSWSNRERAPRTFSNRQDHHYLSWRDRQIEALDRDYADYCREREQQFHSEFDDWRRKREQGGRGEGGNSNDEIAVAAELERTHERALAEQGNSPSPVGDATLGTNNSENSTGGRR